MRLQKKEEEELARREGLTGNTIIQVIWLAISFGIAYFLTNALEAQGTIRYLSLYNALSIPTTVPKWVVQGGLMLVIVIFMQFIMFIAFAFFSPEGRRRTGEPSLHSRTKDPFDDSFH